MIDVLMFRKCVDLEKAKEVRKLAKEMGLKLHYVSSINGLKTSLNKGVNTLFCEYCLFNNVAKLADLNDYKVLKTIPVIAISGPNAYQELILRYGGGYFSEELRILNLKSQVSMSKSYDLKTLRDLFLPIVELKNQQNEIARKESSANIFRRLFDRVLHVCSA